jgi:hypothetical protein
MPQLEWEPVLHCIEDEEEEEDSFQSNIKTVRRMGIESTLKRMEGLITVLSNCHPMQQMALPSLFL